jgi:24-methylenesterol C-methyltransferase
VHSAIFEKFGATMPQPALPAFVTQAIDNAAERFEKLSPGQKVAVGIGGGIVSLWLAGRLISAGSSFGRRPSAFELTGGSIARENVAKEFKEYAASYGSEAGTGIVDRSKTVHLVDVFYSLVTDIYEWGWGQSFHFSPKLPGKSWKASEAAHEARIPSVTGARPGDKILDCGCGVGGPMRTIAAVSGAHVVGITINEYQVQRATHHNQKVGGFKWVGVGRGL